MSIRENFLVPKRYNTVAFVLMAIGLVAIIALYIATHGGKHDDHHGPILLASTTCGARFRFIEDDEDCLIDPEALLASPFICGS